MSRGVQEVQMNTNWVKVEITWSPVGNGLFNYWHQQNCLYAYIVGSQIYYIGKADRCTVWQRHQSHERDGVLAEIRKKASGQPVTILIGMIKPHDSAQVTPRLLDDLESILIYKIGT